MFKLAVASTLVVFFGLAIVECCDYMDTFCPMPYTKKMQDEIVDFHNEVRSKANPTAKNMQKVYWDDTMAKMAQEHAEKCVFEHNTDKQRRFAGYVNVGQNLFGSTLKPTSVSPGNGWYGEKKWFTYGKKTSHVVGHYTQVMQGQTGRIGCGGAYCPNLELRFLVTCNYLKGQYDYTKPYKTGRTCADCPDSCKNNLCDCGGKVCQNGGKLDINKCRCHCQRHTSGEMCEKLKCNEKEAWYCKRYLKFCRLKYGFYVRNLCPQTCGLCK